jgi:hypothetical protein
MAISAQLCGEMRRRLAVRRPERTTPGKVAIGQMVMGGRAHLVGIKAHSKGLMLVILRYGHELRDEKPYFDRVTAEPEKEAVALAVELIERQSGKFEPKTMPDEYAAAVHEYLRAKVKQPAAGPAYSALGFRTSRSLRHKPAKVLRLSSVGLHLFLSKSALQTNDILQVLSFGQLVS